MKADLDMSTDTRAELAEGLHRLLVALALRAHRRDSSRIVVGDLMVSVVVAHDGGVRL
jgi:hypothetical protein